VALPNFLIVGAPKAGSTALHAALAPHPQLFACTPKEPKYFLCDDRPPDPAHQRGPGDAHSAREWVWQRDRYERMFDRAPAGTLRFESTPFYLWDTAAQARIAATLPEVKIIAVIRDPLDRAFSNWTHLWADGLEPEPDFLTACGLEQRRIDDGWAPFWRYLELGRYGEQIAHLRTLVDPERIRIVRYRRLVDEPERTLDGLCEFLGVRTGVVTTIPPSNVGRWAPHGLINTQLRRTVRAGAALGAYAHPQLWRQASRPLLSLLQRGSSPRALLTREAREALAPGFAADVAQLSELLKEDYTDWLAPEGRGAYTVRRS
jgi:hypothetical protein